MKHIYQNGAKKYAFVSIDPYTKETVIHIANRPTSFQASIAIKRTVEYFGQDITIINDNGSENYEHTYEYLKDLNITQYFTRPRTPKDKPHVENVIGKLQQECLDENRVLLSLKELGECITKWLNDYHFYRPHQSLSYMTPAEYLYYIKHNYSKARSVHDVVSKCTLIEINIFICYNLHKRLDLVLRKNKEVTSERREEICIMQKVEPDGKAPLS